jgi:hypothetical protein
MIRLTYGDPDSTRPSEHHERREIRTRRFGLEVSFRILERAG